MVLWIECWSKIVEIYMQSRAVFILVLKEYFLLVRRVFLFFTCVLLVVLWRKLATAIIKLDVKLGCNERSWAFQISQGNVFTPEIGNNLNIMIKIFKYLLKIFCNFLNILWIIFRLNYSDKSAELWFNLPRCNIIIY